MRHHQRQWPYICSGCMRAAMTVWEKVWGRSLLCFVFYSLSRIEKDRCPTWTWTIVAERIGGLGQQTRRARPPHAPRRTRVSNNVFISSKSHQSHFRKTLLFFPTHATKIKEQVLTQKRKTFMKTSPRNRRSPQTFPQANKEACHPFECVKVSVFISKEASLWGFFQKLFLAQ